MNKNLLRSAASLFAVFAFAVIFTACTQEDDVTSETVNTFVDESVFRMEESGNIGRFGCYELVFPIAVVFADGTTSEAEDYDGLIAAITTWKEANPDSTGRPTFEFPIEVLNEEGEVISVASQEELRELKRACRRSNFGKRGKKGHRNRCGSCFEIQYPLTIAFPDETTVEVTDRQELKTQVRAWKEANPDATDRPTIVYPITVELEDGTTMTINSADELQALKESCDDTTG